MQNHVHFIAIPHEKYSLAKTFNSAHMRYAQYFNKQLKRRGHLWQGRFYSCILDEPHLILAARYIERNPVRAGLVKNPWQWPWSSALTHISGKYDRVVESGDLLKTVCMSSEYWKKYICSKEETVLLQSIRKHTLAGYPLGTTDFIEELERDNRRTLHVSPRGRPKRD